jgi:hypothetical protein
MADSRRTFLKSAGATVLGVTVAGCTGNGSDGADGTTETTTTSGETTTDGETTTTESATTTDSTETTADGNETTADGNTSSTTGESSSITGSVGSESNADLELTEHSFFENGSTEGVRGTVKNISDKTFSLVVVHVNPESDQGDTLERFEVDSSESIDTLEPDATWDFEVTFDGNLEFTQYTIWATGQTEGNSSG